MGGVKGRSGHIGQMGMDPQSPIRIFKGPYRGESATGNHPDLYFWTRKSMLEDLKDIASIYTPMIWDREKGQYIIDSADILGI